MRSALWKHRRRAALAFTLVEVTMVAGIVGGAQGSYTGALDRAKRTVCQHNLKQIYQGLLQIDLFEGRLPKISFYSKDPKKDPHSLLRVLGPSYAGVLVCPTMPEDLKRRGLTYIFNDQLCGKSLSMVRDPSHTWLVMEMTAVVRDKKDPRRLAGPQPHSGGVNVLYADGHVAADATEELKPSQMGPMPNGGTWKGMKINSWQDYVKTWGTLHHVVPQRAFTKKLE